MLGKQDGGLESNVKKNWRGRKSNQATVKQHQVIHTEAFTHTSFSTEAFTQRSFWAQELLHTDAFTHRSLYTRRLLRTEAFTQRSLYIQTLSHRKNDSTEQLLHFYVGFWRSAIISCERVASGVGKPQFLTLDNHFTWKGCAWPCKIAILHKFYFARNGCAWRFKMDKVATLHQFLNVCIWRLKKNSFPTVAVWLSCHACIWTFKITILHQVLTVDSCEGATPGPTKFAFCHMFECPTCAISAEGCPCHHMLGRSKRTISADGCCGQRSFAFHHTTCLPIRHARSPQRVAQGQIRPAFRHTFGCPTRRRG